MTGTPLVLLYDERAFQSKLMSLGCDMHGFDLLACFKEEYVRVWNLVEWVSSAGWG